MHTIELTDSELQWLVWSLFFVQSVYHLQPNLANLSRAQIEAVEALHAKLKGLEPR